MRKILCAVLAVMLAVGAIVGNASASSSVFGTATEQLLRLADSDHVTARRVEELIKAGADVNARDVFGRTAIILIADGAMYKNTAAKIEAIKVLIKHGADVNAKDDNGKTALMCTADYPEAFKVLLKAGANVHATALIQAATLCAPVEIINLLIKAGADVNAKAEYDETALMKAAESFAWTNSPANKKYAEIAKALIKAGANVNAQDEFGKTALMCAAWSQGSSTDDEGYVLNLDVIKLLIKAGADVNVQDNEGITALMYAVNSAPYKRNEKDTADAIRTLINAKADVNLRDNNGKTALDYAKENGRDKFRKILLDAMRKK